MSACVVGDSGIYFIILKASTSRYFLLGFKRCSGIFHNHILSIKKKPSNLLMIIILLSIHTGCEVTRVMGAKASSSAVGEVGSVAR